MKTPFYYPFNKHLFFAILNATFCHFLRNTTIGRNVIIGCTIENQKQADIRLPIFTALPIVHRNIICQPLLSPIKIKPYLQNVELVVVGGESDVQGRVMDYDWVLDIRKQCLETQTHFEFRQCSTNFRKDGKYYHLSVRELMRQAKKADINI